VFFFRSMIAAATTAPPPDPSTEDRAERRMRRLERLAEIGLDMAEKLGRRMMAAPEPPEPIDPHMVDIALAFTRVARGVRMSDALSARLEAEASAREAKAVQAQAATIGTTAIERVRRRLPGLMVRKDVELMIECETDGDEARADELQGRLSTALDEVSEEDFAGAPIGIWTAKICRDLGLRFATEDWLPDADNDEGGDDQGDGRLRTWPSDEPAPTREPP
jgi:hypothetical protein